MRWTHHDNSSPTTNQQTPFQVHRGLLPFAPTMPLRQPLGGNLIPYIGICRQGTTLVATFSGDEEPRGMLLWAVATFQRMELICGPRSAGPRHQGLYDWDALPGMRATLSLESVAPSATPCGSLRRRLSSISADAGDKLARVGAPSPSRSPRQTASHGPQKASRIRKSSMPTAPSRSLGAQGCGTGSPYNSMTSPGDGALIWMNR